MKANFILFVLILLLASGCKSQKPLVSTVTKTSTIITENRDIVFESHENKQETQKKSETKTTYENESTITTTTEYDTSKPTDPATGKHPVKLESKSETTKGKQENTKSDENLKINSENNTNLVDKSKVNLNKNTILKQMEESPKDPYRYRYIFYIIGSIILTGVIFFIYSKKSIVISFIRKRLGF